MMIGLLMALAVAPATAAAPPQEVPMSVAPASTPAPGAAPAVPRPGLAIVGGYARMSPHARELRPVLAAALGRLTPTRNARARIVTAEQQVVAGTNYRLLVKLRDGSRWRVVVWRRLDGAYEVTESLREG